MYYEVRSTINGMTAVEFYTTIEKAKARIEEYKQKSKGRMATGLRQIEKLPYEWSVAE